MNYRDVLAGVTWLLLSEGAVTYRRIRREFDLDSATLEDVRHELIQTKRCALDRDGEFLVWAGTAGSASAAASPMDAPRLEPLTPLAPDVQGRGHGVSRSDTAGAAAAGSERAPEQANAERRQLTVMFCDLVGSTDLSGRLDAENLREVVRAYQETAAEVIQRYDGHIAQYLGDGLLVYFGYPTAHGDDGRRAVHAALGIVEGLAALNTRLQADYGVQLAVRLGIHTGPVVVGEMGGGGRHEQLALGETPNIAARLEGLAGPNGIVVGSLTKELAGDAFVYDDLGERELKGVAGRVKTWGVIGRRNDSAHEADHDENDGAATVPQLIGRDEETGLLRRAWQSTNDEGRGQVVMISGEAGIGKSVLIDGLRAEVRAEGLPRVTLRCSPYHSASALYPVIEHFKRFAGWQPEDSTEQRIAKLEASLATTSQFLGETLPLLASLLSLPLPEDRYPPLSMTPQQQKRQTQDAVIAMILETAERQPMLQLWEDLHWADPSTLELLGLLMEQAPTASLLMVLTARPEFVPPWPARSHITPITLNRLERPHAEALVARIAGMKPLPAEVVDHIVTKTDGVPLYVEELTKTILASDILRDAGERFELTGPLASLAIPDTLQESLMARLDRLPQVRELAQLGSVLGREFAYEMISGLSTAGETLLQEGLGQLVEAELLYQRGRPPRAKYIFKHALLQDAAYASLLRRTRQQYHLQVAQLLEARFPETVETNLELLANHYSEANVADRAVEYLQKAGERSLRMSANVDAITHLTKGLEIVRAMPSGRERDQRELNMLMTMGPALIATKGYAAPEVEPAHRRALELCVALEDEEKQFSVLLGLSLFHLVGADLNVSRGLAEQLVELAKTHQEPGCDLAAGRALGYALLMLGDIETARTCMERVSDAYDVAIHGAFAFRRGGSDFGVGCLSFGAWGHYALGYPDQAKARCAQGLALAQELRHPISECVGHWSYGVVHLMRGETDASLGHAEALLAIAEERGFPQYSAWARVLRGTALSERGVGADAIAEIREGIDACQAIGSHMLVPYWLGFLAEACGRNGRAEEGRVAIAEALRQVARTDNRYAEAELYRLEGQLLLAGDAANHAEAEACFQKAIEIARAQKAKSWELRAATSLARLWQQQGRQGEARDLLAPVYDWFTEAFDTADLKQARSLLDELEAPVSIAVGATRKKSRKRAQVQ